MTATEPPGDQERTALDLFADWLEWPQEQRDDRLAEVSAGQPALLAEVRRLIRAEVRASALPTVPPIPHERGDGRPLPDRIGVYRLGHKIGEGGMGLVFAGERDDGIFAQSVAIKLIRRSLFSGSAAAQFASERQILARMRHPHIAQLFDGGISADGDSYFIMERIHGQPITVHCEAAGLSRRKRMALMQDVCAAVQFAHQQLVVHADIKPSNVLIDDRYGVKLVDFGIARMIDAGGEANAPGGFGRTGAYASPQQDAGLPPTPADDIFALGRLLGDVVDDGTSLDPELLGIIARATAADPRDRYPTVDALSVDIERWLQGRPVHALPHSGGQKTAMFVRRHWLGVGTTTLAVLMLLGAITIVTTLYFRAEAARQLAERRFADVRHLSNYLLIDVTDTLQHFPGTSRLRRDVARRGRSYLESLGRLPGAPVDMQIDIARGYVTTAAILGVPTVLGMGDPVAAKHDLAIAEPSLRRLWRQTHRPDVAITLAQALATRASIAVTTYNNVALGEKLFSQACALARSAAPRPDDVAGARQVQTRCLLGLAALYDNEARFGEMAKPIATALALLEKVPVGMSVEDVALARGNAFILRGDADYYLDAKPAALADYQQAVTVLAAGQRETPDVRILERTAWADYNLASLLDEMKRSREGLAVIDRGVAMTDQILLFERSPRAQHISNGLHSQRAVILDSLHRYAEAIAEEEKTVRAFKAMARAQPGNFEIVRDVPVNLRPLGEIYWDAGRRAKACEIFAETDQAWSALARTHGVMRFDATVERKIVQKLRERCAGKGL